MSGLVLQSSTAEWLVSLGCLDRGSLCPLNGAGKGGSVVLDEAASARFEAGAAVAELLASVPGLAAVETFKNSTTALARMHNWSQLVPALETLGVDVDPDARARIVAGDSEVVAGVLHALHARLKGAGVAPRSTAGSSRRSSGAAAETAPPPPPPPPPPPSVAALLLASTADYLGVSAEAAQALLAHDTASLHALLRAGCAPGGPPGGCAGWLDALGARSRQICSLVAADPPALTALLPFYASGLASASPEAAAAAAHAAAGLARSLRACEAEEGGEGAGLFAVAHAWFVAPNQGPLSLLVPCLSAGAAQGLGAAAAAMPQGTPQHSDGPSIASQGPGLNLDAPLAALLVDRFCRRELRQLFGEHLGVAAADPTTRMAALAGLLRRLAERGANLRRAFLACGAAGTAAREAVALASPAHAAPLRAAALSALTALWSSFSEATEAAPEVARSILVALKAAARTGATDAAADAIADVHLSADLAVHAHGCLLALLHALVDAGSPFAPVLFKALIFSMVEHHAQEAVRDAALGALKDVVERHPGIPVGALVEPLARRMTRLGLCFADGALADALAHHPRLEARHAAMLLKALAPACVSPGELRGMAAGALVSVACLAATTGSGCAMLGRISRSCCAAFEASNGACTDGSLPASLGGSPLQRSLSIALLMRLAALDCSAVSDALRPCVAAAARTAVGVGHSEAELDLVLDALNGALRPRVHPRRSTTGADSADGVWDEDADEDTAAAAAAAAAELAALDMRQLNDDGEENEDRASERSRSVSFAESPRGSSRGEAAPAAAARPSPARAGRRSTAGHKSSEGSSVSVRPSALRGSDGARTSVAGGRPWGFAVGSEEAPEPPEAGGGQQAAQPQPPPVTQAHAQSPASGVKADTRSRIEAIRRERTEALATAQLEYERARLASAHMRTRLVKRRDELLLKGRKPFWDRVLAPVESEAAAAARARRAAAAAAALLAWRPAGNAAVAAGRMRKASPKAAPAAGAASSQQTAHTPQPPARQSWAQALILEALDQRLAADPSYDLPAGYTRTVVEEVEEYTELVMDEAAEAEADPDDVSALLEELLTSEAGPPAAAQPRLVTRSRERSRTVARPVTPLPLPAGATASTPSATPSSAARGAARAAASSPSLGPSPSSARVPGGPSSRGGEPVLGPDGLYPFERVPARFIAAAVEDMLASLAAKVVQEEENRKRDARMRAGRALQAGARLRSGDASESRAPQAPLMVAAALTQARGAAAVAARLEELRCEERARRARAKDSEAAEREASRKKAEAARAAAAQIAEAKLARRAASDGAKAARDAEAAAARAAEESHLRRKREEDKARVQAFQAAQRAEAESKAAAMDAAARLEAERKAEDLRRVKKELLAKGRGLGQQQAPKMGVAAEAARRLAEVADGAAADEVLDELLREMTPAPPRKYDHVLPRVKAEPRVKQQMEDSKVA